MTADSSTLEVLIVGSGSIALICIWGLWKLCGKRWWIRTTRCSVERHEWVRPQYFHNPGDLMAELGAAVIWATTADRVCYWCRVPKLVLMPPRSEVLEVQGDWGIPIIPVKRLQARDEEWLNQVGAKW